MLRFLFAALVILHGLLHLLGFVKAFQLGAVPQLSLPISRFWGVLWLIATILFLAYAVAYISRYPLAWLIGFTALIISQTLIIVFWQDASFGSLANLIILLVLLVSLASYRFTQQVRQETNQLHITANTQPAFPIRQEAIARLPPAVQRWITRSGLPEKGPVYSAQIRQQARMKLKPDQKNWYEASASQYTSVNVPAFVWQVEMPLFPAVFVFGRDKYMQGRGEMLIRLNALIPIVNEKGPKLSEGSLQRFLGEMVWLPSLALSPYVRWEAVGDNSAKATLTYKGVSGSGTFTFNEAGDCTQFEAQRYKDNTANAQRYPWIMSIEAYGSFEGLRVPVKMNAHWELDSGPWTWLELEVTDIQYNPVTPF